MAASLDIEELALFGATPGSVIEIGSAVDHRHLDYLDLPELPRHLPRVTSVVEMAGRPVLYVVRGPLTPADLEATCHLLAQRGAADHLGIIEPGVLKIVPLIRTSTTRKITPLIWKADDRSSRERLPGLAFGINGSGARGTANRLHDELVTLLTSATRAIVNAGIALPEDALSLVGRALFLRFLIDRRIIGEPDAKQMCPGAGQLVLAMSTPTYIDATSEWLDGTFNGNLLPMSHKSNFWRHVRSPQAVCAELTKILLKTDATGQLRFEWASLDFGHIPVGLLSQVYEKWCHAFSRRKAILHSVWYTPRAIAEYLVDEVFFDLDNAHNARVLDPAVGAGVFLVAVYREIVAARWRHDGVRPDRRVLREILYRQLAGFDVNEASLRLTALALYLTALELDPDPHPLDRLRFEDLRVAGVLQDVCGPLDDPTCVDLPMIGSLGPHLPSRHKGAYDVVLGNPPWTAWTSATSSSDVRVLERRRLVENTITPILSERAATKGSNRFEMVDFAPDLAFCWRALEWTRPGGTIAFALHTRLLFRQSPNGVHARNQLFSTVTITGILNGAALAQTNVWPSHEAPFCLLFATNRLPSTSDGFHIISPVIDKTLNSQGHLRVDASDARIVFQSRIQQQPWLLKTLYRGSELDADIMLRLMKSGHPTLGDYLEEFKIRPSRGYVEGAGRSTKRDAPHLHALRELTEHKSAIPLVNVSRLKLFKQRRLNTARRPEVFLGPLVLFFEAPRHDRGIARAILCRDDVAFNHVFIGFSTHKHRAPQLLADYLLILLNSSLVLYIALMRSLQFGSDRKRLDLSDLLLIPFPRLETLSGVQKRQIRSLAKRILSSELLPEHDIDAFSGALLGLSVWDMEVLNDTLSVSLPFKNATDLAQLRPTADAISVYSRRVQGLIASILGHVGRNVEVTALPANEGAPWLIIRVMTWPKCERRPIDPQSPHVILETALDLASDTGQTRVVFAEREGHLLIAIFAQYRYWTPTQGRLLVLDLFGDPTYEPLLRGGTA